MLPYEVININFLYAPSNACHTVKMIFYISSQKTPSLSITVVLIKIYI